MKIYRSLAEFSTLSQAVTTIGTFDGVHLGHRKLLSRIVEIAKERGGESVLLTFYPHPRMVLYPEDTGLNLLTTMEERTKLFEEIGIDHLIIHPFSQEFSRMNSVEFVRDILMNGIGTKVLVIGYDHHFGRNREGSLEQLKELAPLYNFEVEEIPEMDVNNLAVSSTKIRQALLEGDVDLAKKFLGYEYFLTGMVIRGQNMGRGLGYPTANISIKDKYKLIPAEGIFAVKVSYSGNLHHGMLYIGNRPTFNGKERSIEVNIFDFDKNIYSEEIIIYLSHRIRGDMKFDHPEDLSKQMERDKHDAIKWLN